MSEVAAMAGQAYMRQLRAHPLRTKAVTSGVLPGRSGAVAQKISGVKKLQLRRLILVMDIKENPVLIYMKGYPDAPRCGFNALAVKVLQQYGVFISARDILSNMKLKESVKAYT